MSLEKDVRYQVRRSYPGEPTRAEQVVTGVLRAVDAMCTVQPESWDWTDAGDRRVYVRAITITAPKSRRPPSQLAQLLKVCGFQRTTNHTWAYPIPRPA